MTGLSLDISAVPIYYRIRITGSVEADTTYASLPSDIDSAVERVVFALVAEGHNPTDFVVEWWIA